MGVENKMNNAHVVRPPLAPQLADSIRAIDSKTNRYARCRGLRFPKTLHLDTHDRSQKQ